MIGRDPITGSLRLTCGIGAISGGIGLVPLLVGVVAVSELMLQLARAWHRRLRRHADEIARAAAEAGYDITRDRLRWTTFRGLLPASFLGAGVGTFIGASSTRRPPYRRPLRASAAPGSCRSCCP